MCRMATVFCVLALPGAAWAGKTLTWQKQSSREFQAGKLSRLVATNRDRLQLSRELAPLADLNVATVWKLAVDRAGNVFAATSGPGSLVRIDSNGTVTTLFHSSAQHVFSVAVAPDGAVYGGVSPTGAIVRVAPGGKPEVFFETGERYVWALAFDRQGDLWAATGSQGKLYRVSPAGKSKFVFQGKASNLLSVAIAQSGLAYVGTDRDGLVYRVAADGKGYVVHDASQPEIHALLLAADGTLYATTASPQRPASPTGSPFSRPSGALSSADSPTPVNPPAIPNATQTQDAPKAEPKDASATKSAFPSPFNRQRTPVASPASPTASENAVYRIDPDGGVDQIFQDRAMLLSVHIQDGRMFLGTGPEGRLFELDLESGEHGQVARLEHGQLSAIIRRPDGSVVVGGANPGKVYVLHDRFAASGEYTSEVLDGKMLCRWGRAMWDAETPAGSRLEFAYRTGNVAEPDETWTGWSPDPTRLPAGRFVQFRIDFASPHGATTPSLRRFALHYTTVNRGPELTSIDTPSPQTPVAAGNRITLRWRASDPNEDTLTFRLELRKDDWPRWVTLADDLTSSEFGWEPSSVPEGVYQIKVTATDKRSNREKEALVTTRTSEAFTLDRNPPSAQIAAVKGDSRRLEIPTTGRDSRSRIVSAEYSLDGGAWTTLHPDDGLFDGLDESATIVLEATKPGEHVIVVRYRDAAGHAGVADKVVSVK